MNQEDASREYRQMLANGVRRSPTPVMDQMREDASTQRADQAIVWVLCGLYFGAGLVSGLILARLLWFGDK